MRRTTPAAVILIAALAAAAAYPVTVVRGQTSFVYTYDGSGQLQRVVDSSGTQIEYVYDAVGNITAIERTTVADGPLILGFHPSAGGVGTPVTIQGRGFAADPLDNAVAFGGAPAVVRSVNVSGTVLTVNVPAAAATGPIALGAGSETTASADPFTVLPAPVVLSVDPQYVFPGETVDVVVTGANLAGVVFSFEPALQTPTLMATVLVPSETTPTLQVVVSASAVAETFVLVATNDGGSSGLFSDVTNTLRVLDPAADADFDNLTNAQERTAGTNTLLADTDGDTFPDGLELAAGTDALSVESYPSLTTVAEVVTPVFSILATTDLGEAFGNDPVGEAVGPVFSIEAP